MDVQLPAKLKQFNVPFPQGMSQDPAALMAAPPMSDVLSGNLQVLEARPMRWSPSGSPQTPLQRRVSVQ